MAHSGDARASGATPRRPSPRWLYVALLVAAWACYPDPDELRPGDHGAGGQSGGQVGGHGGGAGVTGTGAGGRTGAAGGSGSGGSTGTPGTGGRTGAGGSGTGGNSAGAGGAGSGAGGRTGAGGTGMGGTGVGGVTAGAGGAAVARCGDPPCGGNLLGTWDIIQSCTSPQMDNSGCAGQLVSFAGIQRVGFITFNSNFTYSADETQSGTYSRETPQSCLDLDGITCAALQAAYQPQTQPPNPTLLSATCTVTAIGCKCVLGVVPSHVSETGTYVTTGTKLILSPNTGASSTNDYCVTGSMFRMIYPDSTPTAPENLVFQKR
jgi:hypothetical protein